MEQNKENLSLDDALRKKAEAEEAQGIVNEATKEALNKLENSKEMSPWQKFKAAQGTTRPWDMLKAEGKTTDQIAQERYDICLGCEHLIKLTKQCKKCGCFMNLKTKLAGAECPVGKWKPVDVIESGA